MDNKMNILEQKYYEKILCVKLRDNHTNRIVYRARGTIHDGYIKPMEAELHEFKNLDNFVSFVQNNWKMDIY